jgi:hypothetical protein
MSHSIISSPEALTNPIPRTSIITYTTMVRLVDQAKLKKLISFIRLVPHLSLPYAMKMAKYSNNKVSDCSLQRVLLHHLPGHSLVAFREILAGKGASPRNCGERLKKQGKQGAIERSPPPERTPPPIDQTPLPVVPAPCRRQEMVLTAPNLSPEDNCNNRDDDAAATTLAAARKKIYNCTAYIKKVALRTAAQTTTLPVPPPTTAAMSVTRQDATQHNAMRCDATQCDATQRDTMRCDAI